MSKPKHKDRNRQVVRQPTQVQPQQPQVVIPGQIHQLNLAQMQTTTVHVGPIPSPEALAAYEATLPGLAQRLVVMAEKEQQTRIDEGKKINDANIVIARRNYIMQMSGLGGAFVLSISFLGAAIYLGMTGHEWLAGAIVTATLGTLAGGFVFDRINKPPQEQKK